MVKVKRKNVSNVKVKMFVKKINKVICIINFFIKIKVWRKNYVERKNS